MVKSSTYPAVQSYGSADGAGADGEKAVVLENGRAVVREARRVAEAPRKVEVRILMAGIDRKTRRLVAR